MNEEDRKKIKRNLVRLEKMLKLDDRFQRLMIHKKVFSEEMMEDILAVDPQNLEFCMKLMLRGPGAFRSFLEALIECEQFEVVRLLEPTIDINSVTGENPFSVSVRNVPVPAAPNPSPSPVMPPVDATSEPRRNRCISLRPSGRNSSQSPTSGYENVERDLQFESNGVMRFEVRQSSRDFFRQSSGSYPVDLSRSRGRVLIININSFDNNIYDTRVGSETDVWNLDKLFRQLGYIVTMKQDVTHEHFESEIEAFVQREDHKDFSSCFVFIMSHGDDLGNGHWGVVAKDGKKIDVEEILGKFSNTRAKSLIGKPKVIVVNACRGQMSDRGVAHRQTSHSPSTVAAKRPRTYRDGHNESGHEEKLHRTFDDMLYVKSTAFGFASHRETCGSWLIMALCHVFAEHACDHDVESLFKKIDEKIKRWRGVENQCQTIERSSRGLNKSVYLYPGLSG